jgi:hypothetical protein
MSVENFANVPYCTLCAIHYIFVQKPSQPQPALLHLPNAGQPRPLSARGPPVPSLYNSAMPAVCCWELAAVGVGAGAAAAAPFRLSLLPERTSGSPRPPGEENVGTCDYRQRKKTGREG